MPRVGIVVEGVEDGYDQKALAVFVRRVLSNQFDVVARPCGGKSDLMRKFTNYLEEFRYRSDIGRVFVIRDADGKCFGDLLTKMQGKINTRNPYPFRTHFLIIRQELETWFLADESALARITRRHAVRRDRPEAILNAKEELRRILSECQISYTATVSERLAKEIDLETVKSRCPSFRRFCDLLSTC